LDDDLGLGGVRLEPVREVIIHDALDEGLDVRVAQLRLGLALELRVADLDTHDG